MPLYNPPLATPVSIANGGTNNGSLAVTAGGTLYTDGSKLVNVGAGTSGQVLKSNGASAPSWAAATAAPAFNITSQTSTYSAAINDYVLASGAAFTVTLPTAVGNSGTLIGIKKTDSTAANIITIATTSSQTIDDVSTVTLRSQYDELVVVSNGTNWNVLINNVIVAASYYVSANFAASTTVPINFDTKDFDTHNAVTPSATVWKFTAPVAGLYEVSGPAQMSNGTYIVLYKNNSAFKQAGGNPSANTVAVWSTIVSLAVNDYIDIRPGASATVVGGSMSANGVGNINIRLVK